jgi:hypothetical protein
MTWKGENPCVTLVKAVYETGKKVEKKVMEEYEKMIDRGKGEVCPYRQKNSIFISTYVSLYKRRKK